MKTKKYKNKKSNIFNKFVTASKNGSNYKKTRKIKGGEEGFFSRLFKSGKNDVNIQSQATTPVTPVAPTYVKTPSPLITGITQVAPTLPTFVKTPSPIIRSITSLSAIVSSYLTDPGVLKVITGIASTSIVLASGGTALVVLTVLSAAWLVVIEKKKAYRGLIMVMDELYLVMKKLSGIMNVSMHIAEMYGFPIDTRDVGIALNTILTKFDELLDPTTTDYTEIKRNLSDLKALNQKFESQASSVINAVTNAKDGDDSNDSPKITLWTRVTSNAKQVITFSAPKFIEELNESVAYLALHVAALSSSFSMTYTTVVVQLLVSDKKDELAKLQAKVLDNSNFHSMLETALVIPLTQSLKAHKTCIANDKKDNTTCDKIFITSAENSRLYMKSKLTNSNLESGVGSVYKKMTNLRKVVDSSNPILSVNEATTFATDVNQAFENDINKSSDKSPSLDSYFQLQKQSKEPPLEVLEVQPLKESPVVATTLPPAPAVAPAPAETTLTPVATALSPVATSETAPPINIKMVPASSIRVREVSKKSR